jgi:AcrR family transcriptional regulator
MAEPALSLSERRKQELRAEIVDAAFAEFSERGYHDTGIAHIAERLGIGHGTFYRYFENKRDILDHVMTGLIERTMATLAADNAPDAAATLEEYRAQTERIAESLTRILEEDPRVLRMLLLESTSIDPELTERVLGVFAVAEQMTAAYFENGVKRGYLRADLDVDATATAVVGAMLGAMVRALREPDDSEQHLRVSRAVLHMMLEGIVDAG